MKRFIAFSLVTVLVFNVFALDLADLRKSNKTEDTNILELLDDTEEYERGFDWITIPEIDTSDTELPNNEFYEEKEKETVEFITSLKNKVKDFIQSLQ